MSYFTESQLSSFSKQYRFAEHRLKNNPYQATSTIFLSHSHKDKKLIAGLQNYLATLGIDLYIDWQDSGMPEITNRKTAENIKKKIKELNFFLVLATHNAINSRWVPWEIGIADTVKANSQIALIPVADSSGTFYGNEYLQLYRSIEFAEGNQLTIFEPNKERSLLVKEWLGK